MRRTITIGAFLLVAATGLRSQTPAEFRQLSSPSQLDSTLRRALNVLTPGYNFAGFTAFGRDSILIVFDDPTLTTSATREHTWMFGPPVTVAEADGCPPEKVLGRKIARLYWRAQGRPAELQAVMVAVRGTVGESRWTSETMYYWHSQLEAPWVGDRSSP